MSGVSERLSGLSRAERALLFQRLKQKKAHDGPAVDRILPRPGTAPPPLSFGQQRFWFLDRLRPGDPGHDIAAAYRIAGPLDAPALRRAVQAVVDRHESLRTIFRLAGDSPVQVIAPRREAALPVVDLTALPHTEEAVERLWLQESRWSFDLAAGPLLRTTLLRLGPGEHVLLLVLHHIVSDGWSMGVLIREAMQLYEAFRSGAAPDLPALPIQYADFAVWQREWLAGARLEEQLAYWRQRLEGMPEVLDLPSDRPRPPQRSSRGSCVDVRIGPELAGRLKALARSQSTTVFVAMLAVFQTLLHRWSGQADLAVGTPIASRNRAETLGLIGFFVNALVLRGDLAGDPGGRELVGQLGRTALDAYAHQDLPFEKLVEELRPERDPSRTPLFQAVLTFQTRPEPAAATGGLVFQPIEPKMRTAQVDLTLNLEESEGLNGLLEYSIDLYEAATIGRMAACLLSLAEALAADPGQRISDLPLLSAAGMEQVLAWGRAPATGGGNEVTFPGRVAARAAETPDAVAIESGDVDNVTYRELAGRAAALAGWLRRAGVEPEEVVGLCADRSPDLVTGLLGTLWAGGAFLPLDPAYPRERLAWMLSDSGARVLLTQERLVPELPGFSGEVFLLDRLGGGAPLPLGVAGGGRAGEGSGEGALAYLIYTSGSTGRPKGVMVPHRGLANLAAEQARAFGVGPGSRVLQLASPSFDASVSEIAMALGTGATLCLASRDELLPGPGLARLLQERRITTATLPPSSLAVLPETGLPDLSTLIVAGEPCPPALAGRWGAGRRLFNAYGPTEGTVCATIAGPGPRTAGGRLSIGLPLAGIEAHILDRHLRPVPAGVPGELCLGGAGLARGYLGRPDLTAAGFVPHPFGGRGERLYRTGDLARRLSSGELDLLGRIDRQVKVRGVRIEPGEVEAALALHPGVREAAVVVPDAGERRLVGCVVPRAGVPLAPAELRVFLAARLPDALLPSGWLLLDALPVAPGGKLDRKALARQAAEAGGALALHVAPRTPEEEMLAGLFAEVLGLPPSVRPGAHDSFFDLGGHSLIGVQLASRIREAFGVEVPLEALFDAPTVAGLAAEVARSLEEQGLQVPDSTSLGRPEPVLGGEAGGLDTMSLHELADAAGLPPEDLELLELLLRQEGVQLEEDQGIRRVPAAEAPLSFSQERLWFLDRLTPGTATYNMPGPLRLRGPLDPAVLALCFTEIARRHESLRTRFALRAGTPVQVIDPAHSLALPLVDLTALPPERRDAEAGFLIHAESSWPFHLEHGPLLRTLLLRLAGDEHVLLMTMHHIISDGWSMGVLFRELATLYEAFAAGAPSSPPSRSPLPELPVQYADFARWQRERLAGPELEAQLAYWRERLAGSPEVIDLPLDRPRPPVQTFQGEAVQIALPWPLSKSLKALSVAEGASPFMTLLAAFALLLGRWSGQDDLLVGSPIAGRVRPEIEGLIGFFLNTLVLRTDLSGNPSFRELLRRVREAALGAYAHQDVPFERLLEDLQPERDLSRTPLFQVFFNMVSFPRTATRLPSRLTLEPLAGSTAVESKFDLTVYAAEADEGNERDEGFTFNLVYNADLFDRERMQELLRQYRRVLEQAAAQPDAPIDVLSLVTPEALALLPDPVEPLGDAWHGAVHELFAQRARRHPERPAVVDGEGTWTYGELADAVSRLAARLRAEGIVPGDRVAIWAHRSAPLVWAVLATLEAGGAFVVLDPTYPPARLADIVRLAEPRAWLEIAAAGSPPREVEDLLVESPHPLTPSPVRPPSPHAERERGNENGLGGGAPLPLGEGGGGRAGEGSGEGVCRLALPGGGPAGARALLDSLPAAGPAPETGPDDLAYVAFTSGSTGLPKGILGRHGPLSHFLPWQQERFGLTESDRYSLLSGLAHDPLQRDLFTALCTGATLCVPSFEEIATPGRLATWMAAQGVTVAHLTPAMGQILTETGSGGPRGSIPALRWVLLVGDILTRLDVDRIRALAPAVTCVNLYGSTETQRAVGYHVVAPVGERSGERGRQILPLGQGMQDVQLLVVSRAEPIPSSRLAGIGELGEIWVRSPHLARGYLQDEALTADRFRTNPFTGAPGDRIYRTGDLGRYLPNGEATFAGRADQQVKIRGFRIELGEIEAVLGRLPGVRESIVLLREDAPGGAKRLVAYIVPEAPEAAEEMDPERLRDALRIQLPAHMVPAAFVLLEKLPLTPNGKVDRRALARLAPDRPGGQEAAYVEPASDLERVIAGVWSEVLGLERVGVEQNFFDLGGHSLLLVRLHARLQETLGRELTLVDLFNYPNVRALAGYLGRLGREAARDTGASGLAPSKDRAQKQIEAARRQKELARARLQRG